MNDKTKAMLKKKVCKLARKVAPIKSPEWCFGMAGFMIGMSWVIFPMAFRRAYTLPIISDFVSQIPYFEYAARYGGYALAVYFTYLSLYPICRGVQLCYPDEFEAFEHETEMAA